MGVRTPSIMITILSIVIVFSSFFCRSSEACGTAVYWGQNNNERSLQTACSGTIRYNYVNIAYLINFGGGQTPVLHLDRHCDPSTGSCRALSEEIRFCQGRGIKVFLSIGGFGNYTINSPDDAQNVANYLWLNFLSGNPNGPLGDAALDGIDFAIDFPRSTLYWDELAKAVSAFSTPQRKIYLSAAPKCVYPDTNLDAAIQTGLFDFVWVQFYNNPSCDYSGGADSFLQSWKQWSSALPEGSKLSLGLPAHPQAVGSGFIPAQYNLVPEIFPVVKSSPNYGGIALWNRYWDWISSYSILIAGQVCDSNITQQMPNIKMVS